MPFCNFLLTYLNKCASISPILFYFRRSTVQGRKSLSYALISSFLFSSLLVPYTFGMESAESKSNVSSQKENKESFDSSNFSGVTEETINEFKTLDEYILENKDSISEEDFIWIIAKVCSLVSKECKKDEQSGRLLYKHVSSQSIKIRKSKEVIEVRIDDRYNNFADNRTVAYWIIRMLKHFAGIRRLDYSEKFLKDGQTFEVFKTFHCINDLLCDTRDDDKHFYSQWKEKSRWWSPTCDQITINSLLNALSDEYCRKYYRFYS